MPLQATSGAASYDAFGGGAPAATPNYIEDVFSTYLYTNDTYPSNLTITNGIDLSGKGGLVWMKNRSLIRNHNLYDTARGAYKQLRSDGTDAEITNANGYGLTAFNANGFSLGTDIDGENYSNVASWTFRKQPKFFDIVTFTSSASGNKTFSHNLGAVPGCVIIKNTQTSDPWIVYHRSVGDNAYLSLNSTAAQDPLTGAFSATSTTFTISSSLMYNSQTYVAYLFAHDAGGFGLTGTDNVISCGSFTTDGSGIIPTVNLGYEPQWVMFKPSSTTGNWAIADTMRGWYNQSADQFNRLSANLSNAEVTGASGPIPTATGFTGPATNFGAGITYIYIAIRRGPMKVPTSGTSVFSPIAVTNSAGSNNTTNFPVDLQINSLRSAGDHFAVDRLRGVSSTATNIGSQIITNSTAAEAGSGAGSITRNWGNTGFQTSDEYGSLSTIYWNFKRAPSFFDVVCYTGTGSALNPTHSLGVTPELKIIKSRSGAVAWIVGGSVIGGGVNFYMFLETNAIVESTNYWSSGSDSATTFSTRAGNSTSNSSGQTYVAYLFATCAGVSKVGSYTGTATTKQIDCGFTAGARFVLIKKTSGTGSWYVWDSARGIVSGNDPYLLLNSTAAEVTNTDYIDTYSAGFEISSTAPSEINENGGSFIFLAIA